MAADTNPEIEGVNSTVVLSFRYSLKTVDQYGFVEDAQASTVRSRATVKTDWNSSIDTIFSPIPRGEKIGFCLNYGLLLIGNLILLCLAMQLTYWYFTNRKADCL